MIFNLLYIVVICFRINTNSSAKNYFLAAKINAEVLQPSVLKNPIKIN